MNMNTSHLHFFGKGDLKKNNCTFILFSSR